MKKELVPVATILVLLFIAGGFTAVFQGLDVLWQVFVGFLPIFKPIIEQSLSDYFTSAYFIVGVIIFIGSTIGIAFSVKERRVLYIIISSILDLISIISIISNIVAYAKKRPHPWAVHSWMRFSFDQIFGIWNKSLIKLPIFLYYLNF